MWTNKQAEEFHTLLKQFVVAETRQQLDSVPDHIISPIADDAYDMILKSEPLSAAFAECIDIAITNHFQLKGEPNQ